VLDPKVSEILPFLDERERVGVERALLKIQLKIAGNTIQELRATVDTVSAEKKCECAEAA
jgi:hypothetical protein